MELSVGDCHDCSSVSAEQSTVGGTIPQAGGTDLRGTEEN